MKLNGTSVLELNERMTIGKSTFNERKMLLNEIGFVKVTVYIWV